MRESRGKLGCGSGSKGKFFLAWLDGNPATRQSHLAQAGVDFSAPSAMSMTRQRRSTMGPGMLVQVVGDIMDCPSTAFDSSTSAVLIVSLHNISSRYYCGTGT